MVFTHQRATSFCLSALLALLFFLCTCPRLYAGLDVNQPVEEWFKQVFPGGLDDTARADAQKTFLSEYGEDAGQEWQRRDFFFINLFKADEAILQKWGAVFITHEGEDAEAATFTALERLRQEVWTQALEGLKEHVLTYLIIEGDAYQASEPLYQRDAYRQFKGLFPNVFLFITGNILNGKLPEGDQQIWPLAVTTEKTFERMKAVVGDQLAGLKKEERWQMVVAQNSGGGVPALKDGDVPPFYLSSAKLLCFLSESFKEKTNFMSQIMVGVVKVIVRDNAELNVGLETVLKLFSQTNDGEGGYTVRDHYIIPAATLLSACLFTQFSSYADLLTKGGGLNDTQPSTLSEAQRRLAITWILQQTPEFLEAFFHNDPLLLSEEQRHGWMVLFIPTNAPMSEFEEQAEQLALGDALPILQKRFSNALAELTQPIAVEDAVQTIRGAIRDQVLERLTRAVAAFDAEILHPSSLAHALLQEDVLRIKGELSSVLLPYFRGRVTGGITLKHRDAIWGEKVTGADILNQFGRCFLQDDPSSTVKSILETPFVAGLFGWIHKPSGEFHIPADQDPDSFAPTFDPGTHADVIATSGWGWSVMQHNGALFEYARILLALMRRLLDSPNYVPGMLTPMLTEGVPAQPSTGFLTTEAKKTGPLILAERYYSGETDSAHDLDPVTPFLVAWLSRDLMPVHQDDADLGGAHDAAVGGVA